VLNSSALVLRRHTQDQFLGVILGVRLPASSSSKLLLHHRHWIRTYASHPKIIGFPGARLPASDLRLSPQDYRFSWSEAASVIHLIFIIIIQTSSSSSPLNKDLRLSPQDYRFSWSEAASVIILFSSSSSKLHHDHHLMFIIIHWIAFIFPVASIWIFIYEVDV
jgi:hypothetical protein